MHGETVNGRQVSDAEIEQWADEAEAGYSVPELRKRGRKPVGTTAGTVVPVRMDKELLDALSARAAHDHVSRSEAIRAAVKAWIDAA
ncbi:ribbon-helix-helix domain-containing protein [uncultured Leifsonia sp.]|uniref:ribbon-helix-helix domain-containing protein n=1 Tax=uncultured Leifsonia sp. TaxID=340359 RepID=UPI0028D7EB90|nr:ribbon-helix-helix domain-containing protein [uncultured Leifsonia sp.]